MAAAIAIGSWGGADLVDAGHCPARCCPSESNTSAAYDCYETPQAEATNVNIAATAIIQTVDDIECRIDFTYTIDAGCGNDRELRACWFTCAGDQGSPCSNGSCVSHCEELGAVGGGAQFVTHTFSAGCGQPILESTSTCVTLD